MLLGSLALLGWNEFNFVRNVKILDTVKKSVIDVGCGPLDVNMGKPIWTSCSVTKTYDFAPTLPNLSPLVPLFTSSLKGARFTSQSQIYQWTEDKSCTTHGDTKECKYSYQQQWVSQLVDSSTFYCVQRAYASGCPNVNPNTFHNVGSIPSVLNLQVAAPQYTIAIGESAGKSFALNQELTSSLQLNSIGLKQGSLGVISGLSNLQASTSDSGLRLSAIPGRDTVGDVRTTFQLAEVTTDTWLSVIGQQARNPSTDGAAFLEAWDTGMKGTFSKVNWVEKGHVSESSMLNDKRQGNSSTTILLRVGGFLLMFVGLLLFTHPLAVVPEVLPCIGGFLGELVGCALCVLCFFISLGLSLLVIGLAWVAARPLIGAALLAGTIAVFIGAWCFQFNARKTRGRVPLLR